MRDKNNFSPQNSDFKLKILTQSQNSGVSHVALIFSSELTYSFARRRPSWSAYWDCCLCLRYPTTGWSPCYTARDCGSSSPLLSGSLRRRRWRRMRWTRENWSEACRLFDFLFEMLVSATAHAGTAYFLLPAHNGIYMAQWVRQRHGRSSLSFRCRRERLWGTNVLHNKGTGHPISKPHFCCDLRKTSKIAAWQIDNSRVVGQDKGLGCLFGNPTILQTHNI